MAIDKSEFPQKIKANLWSNNSYSIFLYDFTSESKRHRGLIDMSDKIGWGKRDKISVAEAELIKIKNDKKNNVADSDATLDAYMGTYFATANGSPEYLRKMKSHYRRYISNIIGKKKLKDLVQAHIQQSIKYQKDKGLSERTIKQTMECLNPAFKSAIANRLIHFNPLDGIKIKLPKTKKIVNHASKKLEQIYNAVHKLFSDNPFYMAIFLFAMQGRRKSEILTLRWENINFQYDYYVLRDTKNNEEQKIYLPANIKEELLKFNEVEGWVFESRATGSHIKDIRKQVVKVKNEIGDEQFGLHYLRNVMVSAMAEQGIDSMYLSGALGHNDPNTIKKYLTMNYLKSSEMASGVIEGIVKKL